MIIEQYIHELVNICLETWFSVFVIKKSMSWEPIGEWVH